MKVNSCTFNNFKLELDFEISKELFSQSENVIKEKCLYYAEDILKKFGQSKKLVLNKHILCEDDMTILCVYLIK